MPEDFSTDFLPSGGREVASIDVGVPATDDYREARRQFEIAFIKGKLRKHGGNITRTAAAIESINGICLHRSALEGMAAISFVESQHGGGGIVEGCLDWTIGWDLGDVRILCQIDNLLRQFVVRVCENKKSKHQCLRKA